MNAFKRRLVLLIATLWTGLCLALPTPHDIEQAVAQGHLTQAEQMLREVIAEKPNSAKAHYELAQVLAREGQHSLALQAMRQARELDPSLKFAQSADKFNALQQAIEQQASIQAKRSTGAVSDTAHAVAVATNTTAPAHAPASWFWPALLTGGFALLLLALWRRVQSRPALLPQPAGMGTYAPETPRGFGAQYDPRGAAQSYGSPYTAPAPAAGSGVAGAVVGGLAGVAAGYALSKALEDHERPLSHSDSVASSPRSATDDMGVVRMDDGQDLGSFDAGSGDGWDSPASDDSW